MTRLNPLIYALASASFPCGGYNATVGLLDDIWIRAVVFYLLRILAWVFAALLLAGVTGLLRKQTSGSLTVCSAALR